MKCELSLIFKGVDQLNHHVKKFSELSVQEFYEIVKERMAIFVVEQDCPYQEVDEIDPIALHHFYEIDGEVVAYNRIYVQEVVHIGRVIVKPAYRKHKLGKQLMEASLVLIEEKYPELPIEISAQAHLQKFYAAVGFTTVSDIYLEDDIPHVKMVIEPS